MGLDDGATLPIIEQLNRLTRLFEKNVSGPPANSGKWTRGGAKCLLRNVV
jgi:hypothetical protein